MAAAYQYVTPPAVTAEPSVDLSGSLADETALIAALKERPDARQVSLNATPGVSREVLRALHHVCPEVEVLELRNNPAIGEAELSEVAHLRHLSALKLGRCTSVDDQAMRAVARCEQLVFLELVHCHRLTASGIARLRALDKLRALLLGGCEQIGDEALTFISGFTALEDLRLVRCRQIRDRGFGALGALSRLTHLNLNECTGLGPEGIQAIGSLRTLVELRLSGCAGVGDTSALQGLARLQALSLTDTRAGETLLPLLEALRGLRELRLRGLYLNEEIPGQLARLRSLEVLDISAAHGLSSRGLSALHGAEALVELGLSELQTVRDDTPGTLPRNLQVLSFARCPTFGPRGIAGLVRLSSLQKLSLSGCYLDDTVATELARLKALRAVDLSEVTGMTASGFEAIFRLLPSLLVLTGKHEVREAPDARGLVLQGACDLSARA